MAASLETYQALVLSSTSKPLELTTKQVPTAAAPGTVVVQVLATSVLPYLGSVLDGTLPYTLSLPMVPSNTCVARVHATPGDATLLKTGQLVFCDVTLRARDDPSNTLIMGLHGGGAPALMAQWLDGSFGHFSIFPLENVFPLDEDKLLSRLGYQVEDLCWLGTCAVPFGGLASIGLQNGETVIVAPATGKFGSAAALVALSMGASVVAAGRNIAALEEFAASFKDTGRITCVQLTGDVSIDTKNLKDATGGGANCYIDFSPNQAANSTHIGACMSSLRPFGRAAFNGGIFGEVKINYFELMVKSLRIQGRFMFEREHMQRLIAMAESGILPLGPKAGFQTVGKFKLAQFEDALRVSAENPGWGKQVVLTP